MKPIEQQQMDLERERLKLDMLRAEAQISLAKAQCGVKMKEVEVADKTADNQRKNTISNTIKSLTEAKCWMEDGEIAYEAQRVCLEQIRCLTQLLS